MSDVYCTINVSPDETPNFASDTYPFVNCQYTANALHSSFPFAAPALPPVATTHPPFIRPLAPAHFPPTPAAAPPPPPPPPNSPCYIEDPIAYIIEAYEHLIEPQILNPPDAPQSILPLRRYLYRKQFLDEALKLLIPIAPVSSVLQLIPLIQIACGKCGLQLL